MSKQESSSEKIIQISQKVSQCSDCIAGKALRFDNLEAQLDEIDQKIDRVLAILATKENSPTN